MVRGFAFLLYDHLTHVRWIAIASNHAVKYVSKQGNIASIQKEYLNRDQRLV